MSHYAVAQFALEEIIVIAMHIKHSLAGCRIVLLLDYRRHHFAPVVVGHRYCFGNIPVAKHILLPICSTNRHKWLEKEEFIDNLAIEQSLPGIMAVNVAIAVGYKLNKIWGSIFAVLGTILPSFLIILAIAMFLTPETIKNNETLTRIFKGIRPAVVALILSPVFTTAKSAKISWKNAWIPIAISLLIWSNIPVVSSPILYILIGGLFGYFIYSKNFRTAVEKQEGDKQ